MPVLTSPWPPRPAPRPQGRNKCRPGRTAVPATEAATSSTRAQDALHRRVSCLLLRRTAQRLRARVRGRSGGRGAAAAERVGATPPPWLLRLAVLYGEGRLAGTRTEGRRGVEESGRVRPSAGRRGASTTTHPALPRNVRGALSDTALEALSQRMEAPLVLERDAVPVRSYRSRVLGVGVALFAVSVGLVIVVVRPEGASPGSAMDGANEPPVRAHAAAALEGTEERQAVATRRAAPNSSTCGAQSPPDADAVQTDTRPNRPLRARGATDAVQAAVGAGAAAWQPVATGEPWAFHATLREDGETQGVMLEVGMLPVWPDGLKRVPRSPT